MHDFGKNILGVRGAIEPLDHCRFKPCPFTLATKFAQKSLKTAWFEKRSCGKGAKENTIAHKNPICLLGGWLGLRPRPPSFCVKSAGAAETGGPLRPAIPGPQPPGSAVVRSPSPTKRKLISEYALSPAPAVVVKHFTTTRCSRRFPIHCSRYKAARALNHGYKLPPDHPV